jgi:hypothetical protein
MIFFTMYIQILELEYVIVVTFHSLLQEPLHVHRNTFDVPTLLLLFSSFSLVFFTN